MVFPASNLSQENILRDVHDNTNQSLRVSAFSIPPPGGIEVIISQTDDSIRIGDGTNLVTASQVTGKTGLDVNVINSIAGDFEAYPLEKGITRNTFNEVTGVAQGVETTVATYTVPNGFHGFLSRVDYSGTNIATYTVAVNASVKDKKRTNYAVSLNDFTYFESNGNSGLPLVAGDVVTVTALHDRPNLGDFNARILAIEVSN